jgi:hypothetical protein
MQLYEGSWLMGVMQRFLKAGKSGVGLWLAERVHRLAQVKAERLHSRMRKDLLKHDQQLSRTLAFTGRAE